MATLTNGDLKCTECGHVFTEADVAAENPTAWGHPCPKLGTVCEAFREPQPAFSQRCQHTMDLFSDEARGTT